MAKKIVLASGKGGVGKSTTAAMLGRALAALGKQTLIVDCDAGLGTLDLLLLPDGGGVFNWLDVAQGNCAFENAALPAGENLTLLCAPPVRPEDEDLACVVLAVDEADERYDYILFDAPAGLGRGLERAACGADAALIIATADEVSVKGANKADALLRSMGVDETRLIVNRYDVKAAKKDKFLTIDQAIDKTCVHLIGIVPEDPALSALSVTGTLGKRSKSMAAFTRIARRMLGENVPLTLSLLK